MFNFQTIYIRMFEGVETFIPVTAKPLKDNLFEIVSNSDMDLEEDATCIYQFFPGDIIECEIKEDASFPNKNPNRNFLLATKLISSSFNNRKIYELIYLIVKSLGKIKRYQLSEFEKEIKQLCTDNNVIQREHPVIKSWLEHNCK